jgi:hypothetical protein
MISHIRMKTSIINEVYCYDHLWCLIQYILNFFEEKCS